MADTVRGVLMYFILPLWLAAGFADWVCHRKSRIAETAGPKETLIHFLMFGEVGLAIVAAIYLETTSLTIILMAGLLLIHQITAYWDLAYAGAHREITPLEQQVHSLLEMIPLMALLLIALAHWGQVLALVGMGDEDVQLFLRAREPALPTAYLICFFVAVMVFSVIPYADELWRGLKASSSSARP